MELRRNYHDLHYISAVKGDKVVKIINVICGKPNLSFKKLDEISDARASLYTSPTKLFPVVKRFLKEASATVKVKTEPFEEVETGEDKRTSESSVILDELVDDTLGMTLKQLKKKRNTKKRKLQFDSICDDVQRFQVVREESGDSHPEDDDHDLKITLKSWKIRVSKGTKYSKKQKCSHVPVIIGSVKPEPLSYDHLLQPDVSNKYKSIGVEVSLPRFVSSQGTTSGPDDSSFHDSDGDRLHNMKMTCEVLKTGDLSTLEVLSTNLVPSEVSRPWEPAVATVDAAFVLESSGDEEVFKSDYPTATASVTSQTLDTGYGISMEEDSISIKAESEVCNDNPAVDMHTTEDLCLSPGNIESNMIREVDNVSMVNIQPILASVENEDYADLLTCKESLTSILPLCVNSARDDSHMNCFHEHGIPAHSESSTRDNVDVHNFHYDTAAHTNKDTSLMCDSPLYDNPKHVSESVSTEVQECSGLQHPPERLFLARKAISPSSQEKLRRAMKSVELFGNLPTENCAYEICIEVDSKNGVSVASSDSVDNHVITSPKRPKYVKAADISHLADQRTRKWKDSKKAAFLKGSNKAAQPVTSGCKSIQRFSQSAITFSQQQMHDFDRLAGRLTSELRSLKEMMVETLLPESRSAPTSRCNMNEVMAALENVSKVEETSKRWLSIMNRDCNRFCKIMSLAEKEASASIASTAEDVEDAARDCSTTTSKRKKITFADEIGGRLCDVRVYDDLTSSPSKSILFPGS